MLECSGDGIGRRRVAGAARSIPEPPPVRLGRQSIDVDDQAHVREPLAELRPGLPDIRTRCARLPYRTGHWRSLLVMALSAMGVLWRYALLRGAL
jgi:hypothetical protein